MSAAAEEAALLFPVTPKTMTVRSPRPPIVELAAETDETKSMANVRPRNVKLPAWRQVEACSWDASAPSRRVLNQHD